MAEYRVISFENSAYGITNIHITDDYKVADEIPTDFYYDIKVNGGRATPPPSVVPLGGTVLDYSILNQGVTQGINKECAFYLDTSWNGLISEIVQDSYITRHNMDYTYTEVTRNEYSESTTTTTRSVSRTDLPYSDRSWNIYGTEHASEYPFDADIYFSTNMPIFETFEEAYAYRSLTGDARISYLAEHCINYGNPPQDLTEDSHDYYIYNRYQHATVERGIITTEDTDIYHWANERILYNGTDICLYRYDSSNPFKLKIKCGAGLVGSYYSTSTSEVQDAEYNQFTLDTLEYDAPFYSGYNIKLTDSEGEEIETPDYDGYLGTLSTNIPIWNNEDDADSYIEGDLDITESYNWGRISQDPVNKELAINTTGEEEDETEFGEVYTRAFFSQMYLCNTSALYKISNSLFDYDVTTLTGLWEDIKKGTEMYGTDPMQVIQGLRYYPFDLSSVFTNVENCANIWIGAYNLDLDGAIAKKVIYQNGYIDLGTMKIKRTFKDWRDFEPYTNLYIYLPYVGRYSLDLRRYYDKNVNIRYYIDLRTGACVACLIADGILLDWFDGIIGTEMPITLTDYSSYAQSQLSIIMRNAGLGTGGAGYLGNKGIGIAHKQYQIHQELGDLASKQYSSAYENAYKGIANYQLANGGTVNLAGTETAAGVMAQQASAASAAGASKAGVLAGAGVAAAGVAAAGAVAIVGMKTAFELMQSGTAGFTRARSSSSAMINQFLPQYPTFIFEIQDIDESEYLNELYGRPTNASGRLGDFSGYLEAEDVMLICPIATDNEREEIINLVKAGIYI